ncbi:MAG: spermidine synthase [Aquabacterium sp.]
MITARRKPVRLQDLPGATVSEYDGVRYLHLGTIWVQGAMRIRSPHKLELDYAQRMMALLLWKPLPPGAAAHAVHLGLGSATLTRFTHGPMRLARTTTVELNPTVIGVARLYFRLPDDEPRLKVVQMDAGRWVADASHDGTADLLFVDLYDQEAAAPVLDDEDFYHRCRALLAPGGVMAVNLFGRHASFSGSLRRIAAAFGPGQVWHLAPTREGNAIVIGANGITVPDRAELLRRADWIAATYKLPGRKWLNLVKGYRGR